MCPEAQGCVEQTMAILVLEDDSSIPSAHTLEGRYTEYRIVHMCVMGT